MTEQDNTEHPVETLLVPGQKCLLMRTQQLQPNSLDICTLVERSTLKDPNSEQRMDVWQVTIDNNGESVTIRVPEFDLFPIGDNPTAAIQMSLSVLMQQCQSVYGETLLVAIYRSLRHGKENPMFALLMNLIFPPANCAEKYGMTVEDAEALYTRITNGDLTEVKNEGSGLLTADGKGRQMLVGAPFGDGWITVPEPNAPVRKQADVGLNLSHTGTPVGVSSNMKAGKNHFIKPS